MTEINQLLIYLVLAFLPCLVWLFFFLSKDHQPEPKKVILKVFIAGMLATIPAILVQLGIQPFLEDASEVVRYFLIVGISEEFFKYFAFRLTAQKSEYLDEPVDILVYMIIASLGFATAENIILFFQVQFDLVQSIYLSIIRFMSSFLHALASGVFAFFIAVSFYQTKKRHLLFGLGFILAVVIHGLFNFSIEYSTIDYKGDVVWAPTIVVIITLLTVCYILLRQAFKKLNKVKTICKI